MHISKIIYFHLVMSSENSFICNWTTTFFLVQHIYIDFGRVERYLMTKNIPLKPRPAGKFIRVYVDGIVYEELRKIAKKDSRNIPKTAALKIEEALGMKE